MSITTKLKRVKGLGSAKEGTNHWLMQRVSALALIPLIIWLAINMISLVGKNYVQVKLWIQNPINSLLLILLIPIMFYHGYLGLKVVIEDYIHSEFWKIGGIIKTKFVFIIFSVTTIFAILYINFKI